MKTRILGLSSRCVLALLGAGLLLQACSSPASKDKSAAWRIEPVMQTSHSQNSGQLAEALYRLGRYHEAQSRLPDAAIWYRKALANDASHVEARNALGVLLARQGQLDAAIAMLQEAAVRAPDRSHIMSNLGYALLLAGRKAEAIESLSLAIQLDPANARADSNLRLAQQGEDTRLALTKSVGPSQEAIPLSVSPSFMAPSPGFAATPIPALAVASVVPVLALSTQSPVRQYRLELSNAMGVIGAARRVNKVLRSEGAPPAYLTDVKPFKQAQTQVEYARGYAAEASRLASRLGAQSVPKAGLWQSHGVDVRIVLGKDFAQHLAELELPQLVAGLAVQ